MEAPNSTPRQRLPGRWRDSGVTWSIWTLPWSHHVILGSWGNVQELRGTHESEDQCKLSKVIPVIKRLLWELWALMWNRGHPDLSVDCGELVQGHRVSLNPGSQALKTALPPSTSPATVGAGDTELSQLTPYSLHTLGVMLNTCPARLTQIS